MTSLKITEGPMPKDEAQAEIDARNRGPWKCFHCGEAFGTRETAALHFGTHEGHQPLCTISPEHFRWMEAQHRRNVDDDSEALRTVRSLANEHETLRKRAEEEGYAKGLADAKKYPGELGLMKLVDPWVDFLEARRRCLHAFVAEGKSLEQITRDLSFADLAHCTRVYEGTKKR